MITLEIGNETYHIKNSLDEMTIDQYEDLSQLMVNKISSVDMLVFLGLPIDKTSYISDEDYYTILKNLKFSNPTASIPKRININGKTYQSHTGLKFKLTVKDYILILEAIKTNPTKYLGELVAIVYKDISIPIEDNYLNIKTNAKFFRENLTADKVLPLLNYITNNITPKFLNILTNESTK